MAFKNLVLTRPAKEITLVEAGEIEVPEGVTLYNLPSQGTFRFLLKHVDSQVRIRATIRAKADQAPELETQVIHLAANTQAETSIKTLSCDHASPRYRGIIRIMPGATNCESYLRHQSLLLDTTARSWSIPSLEIGNNQVKCSHAATMRTITDAELFYLRTRGLDTKQSKKLLVQAFLNQ